MSDQEAEALQARHLAYLDEMRTQGHMYAAGPFGDQPDPSWRGLAIYRTSIEETRRLASEDPSVKAGRLAVDILTWYSRKGEVTFGPAAP